MKVIEKDLLKIVIENNTATIFNTFTGVNGRSVSVVGDVEILSTFDSGPCQCYFKDDKNSYGIYGATIKKIKSSNIEVLNGEYVKDHKNVYYLSQTIPGSDPATFTIPNNSIYLAHDKNNVYAAARNVLHIFTDAEIESLEFFPQELKYVKDGRDFYVQSSAYFADKYRIYHFNRFFVEYIQPSDGDALKNYLQKKRPNADAWWNKDKNYFNQLTNIDKYYYTDDEIIYYFLIMENGICPQEIHYPYGFGLSFNTSYYNALIKADINTFKVLNDYYAKDKNHVFHLSRKIDADANSFEVISGHFAMDKNGLWYNGFCAGELDKETFEITEDTWISTSAKDKFGEFYSEYNKKVGKYQCRSKFLKREKTVSSK